MKIIAEKQLDFPTLGIQLKKGENEVKKADAEKLLSSPFVKVKHKKSK